MTDNRKKAKFRDCENCCGRKTNAKNSVCHYCVVEDYGGDRRNIEVCIREDCERRLREFQVDYGTNVDHWYGCPRHDFPWGDVQRKRRIH